MIWSDDGKGGSLSSHRLISTATHLGNGAYGPPTGKALRYRILADCAARENRIYDEWLVRDQGAIVRQLGLEPKRFAAAQIEASGGPERCPRPLTPANDLPPVYEGRGNDHPLGARYAEILSRLMAAELSIVPQAYDRACQLELPGGVTGRRWSDAGRFWLGLRAAFPSSAVTIHHVIGREDPMLPPRAALRWSL